MTPATLFAMMISGRAGLRARMWAQAETKSPRLSGLRRVIGNVVAFTLAFEALTAVALAARFAFGYGEPPAYPGSHGRPQVRTGNEVSARFMPGCQVISADGTARASRGKRSSRERSAIWVSARARAAPRQ